MRIMQHSCPTLKHTDDPRGDGWMFMRGCGQNDDGNEQEGAADDRPNGLRPKFDELRRKEETGKAHSTHWRAFIREQKSE
uniref:Uncharacterized protein n=1 Tax=Globodera rostochiensis TaxID=31243 RepID=A0A914GS37_GLORO